MSVSREQLLDEDRQREHRERQQEAVRMMLNAMWLEREKVAQEEFRKQKELEEKRRKEKEEREVSDTGAGVACDVLIE